MAKRRTVDLGKPPGEWALRELPARAVMFLRSAGTHAAIRCALESGGYGEEEHAEGQRLLLAVCAYRRDDLMPRDDEAARAAAIELEGFTRVHIPRLRAALERLHPKAVASFFEPALTGERAVVLIVASLLAQLTALEQAEPTSEVLETLARRGLDARERERLLAIVHAAQRAAPPGMAPEMAPGAYEKGQEGGTEPEMLALYHWLNDWSATARAFITRKDWLIRLGLADRRRRPKTTS